MTREETQEILMAVQAAYPNYKPPNKTVTVNVWCELLTEYSYQEISAALRAYIVSDSSGFAPSVGQLIDKLQLINTSRELNEMEAWLLVSKALRNGYYGAEQEFDKLPPLVQKAVGAPEQLRNWSQTDMESIENVVQSNFMRTYRTVVAREKQISKMPKDIRVLIDKTNRNMDMLLEKRTDRVIEEKIDQEECVPMSMEMKDKLQKILEKG